MDCIMTDNLGLTIVIRFNNNNKKGELSNSIDVLGHVCFKSYSYKSISILF